MVDTKSMRGQFFTVNKAVQGFLTDLLHPVVDAEWKVLEPSAGNGELVKATLGRYPEATVESWEIDSSVVTDGLGTVIGDFFNLSQSSGKYHSIIGNPPYVAWKNVEDSTKASAVDVKSRYSDKTNLYYLFIDKCIDLLEDNGELIFIQPKEWMYATSAEPLRRKMLETGTITHIIDGGEEKVFPDADVPAIMIFRYQKTKTENHVTSFREGFLKDLTDWEDRELVITNGFWIFATEDMKETLGSSAKVSDYFSVKVGIVTGADKIYNVTRHPDLSKFRDDGTTKLYRTTKAVEEYIDVNDYETFEEIPDFTAEYLSGFKQALMKRGIAKFTESNWWRYGAIRNKAIMEAQSKRIYAFAKTRSAEPFFVDAGATYFGGGLLALFPRSDVDLDEALKVLNSAKFKEICRMFGVTTGNKVSFQPKTLESIPFPFGGDE